MPRHQRTAPKHRAPRPPRDSGGRARLRAAAARATAAAAEPAGTEQGFPGLAPADDGTPAGIAEAITVPMALLGRLAQATVQDQIVAPVRAGARAARSKVRRTPRPVPPYSRSRRMRGLLVTPW